MGYNPFAKRPKMAPTRYKLDTYEPYGMSGIMIVEATLHVEIDRVSGLAYVDDVEFPADHGREDMIPAIFRKFLIQCIHADTKLMIDIADKCAAAY